MNFRQNGDKYLITIEVIALIVVLVFGAVHFVMPGNNANKKITESQQETQNPTQETNGTQQVQHQHLLRQILSRQSCLL